MTLFPPRIIRSSYVHLACISLVSSLFASLVKATCKLDEWRMRGESMEKEWRKSGKRMGKEWKKNGESVGKEWGK